MPAINRRNGKRIAQSIRRVEQRLLVLLIVLVVSKELVPSSK